MKEKFTDPSATPVEGSKLEKEPTGKPASKN